MLLVVVLAGVWLWRLNRPADASQRVNKPQPELLDMVRCTQCGMHLPAAEAIHGMSGPYCSLDHRQRAEP